MANGVRESVKELESLGALSEQIGVIVSTIEDIADQTNLLALNAAIEAARAGEQGRGFAVVSDEVRALAARTAKATREISEMIGSIQREIAKAVANMVVHAEEVSASAHGAQQSDAVLSTIQTKVGDVRCQVEQITVAADEQTATTSEISRNIQDITIGIQGSAQGAQESAQAAKELEKLAIELKALMARFTV